MVLFCGCVRLCGYLIFGQIGNLAKLEQCNIINSKMEAENTVQIESSHSEIKKISFPQTTPVRQPESYNQAPLTNYNGFTQRPTIYQIVPIIYVCFMLAEMSLVCVSIQSISLKISLGVTYFVVNVVMIGFWVKASFIDPSDTIQILHREAIKKQQPFNCSLFKYFCHICQTFVGKDSFHCRKCHRCVQIFDHHCKWLNNCIGAKNYLQFLGLIIMTLITLLFHIIVNSLHLSYLVKTDKQFVWVFYVEIVFIVVDAVPLAANFLLVSMHLYLVVNNKTTLQLILEKRKENKIFPSNIEQHPDHGFKSEACTMKKPFDPSEKHLKIKKKLKQLDELVFSFKKNPSLKKKAKSFKVQSSK